MVCVSDTLKWKRDCGGKSKIKRKYVDIKIQIKSHHGRSFDNISVKLNNSVKTHTVAVYSIHTRYIVSIKMFSTATSCPSEYWKNFWYLTPVFQQKFWWVYYERNWILLCNPPPLTELCAALRKDEFQVPHELFYPEWDKEKLIFSFSFLKTAVFDVCFSTKTDEVTGALTVSPSQSNTNALVLIQSIKWIHS